MSELDEMRSRLDAVEAEVSRLREENATTRALASMADRDVAEMRTALRAHTQSLNALRVTQLEHGRSLEEQRRTLEGIAGAVGSLVGGQAAVLGKLEEITGRD